MTIKIKTNNHARAFLYGYEVPDQILKDQFDYLDEDDAGDGFIKYKGRYYHVSDFKCAPEDLKPWHAYTPDTYFSGIVIKMADDGETYQIGYYFYSDEDDAY